MQRPGRADDPSYHGGHQTAQETHGSHSGQSASLDLIYIKKIKLSDCDCDCDCDCDACNVYSTISTGVYTFVVLIVQDILIVLQIKINEGTS